MNFRSIARKMREPERSFEWRRAAFCECLASYRGLSYESYPALCQRFADEFGFDDKTPDANERLLSALDALENERTQKLEKLRVFDMKRVRAKMRGRRTLSKEEQAKLDAIRRGE